MPDQKMTPGTAVALVNEHGTYTRAALAAGVGETTIRKHYATAVKSGGARPYREVRWDPPDPSIDFDAELGPFVEVYGEKQRLRATAKALGVTYHRARKLYHEALRRSMIEPRSHGERRRDEEKEAPVIEGRLKALPTPRRALPKRGKIRRYLFTSAQNNTHLHEPLWENLHALMSHWSKDPRCESVEMHVARFTYVKAGLGARGDKAEVTSRGQKDLYGAGTDLVWDERLKQYLSDERIEVAPGLVWCGEMNILPTAKNPLSGLEVYTGRSSGVFPHPKLAMESVPSLQKEATKFNYTTGTVTMRNYIQRKAGLQAEFHHCYGALLVEVDHEGDWFVRQLNADSEGRLYDLDVMAHRGKVTTGHRPTAATMGDLHSIMLDRRAAEATWGENGYVDILRPREQHFHDVNDFRGRNHHEIRDPHRMFKRHLEGSEDVRSEVETTAGVFRMTHRPWCRTVVVASNHHDAMGRWLAEQNGLRDPVNAEFWTAMNTRVLAAIRRGEEPDYLREALLEINARDVVRRTRFLAEDESYVICSNAGSGIECGMHGHLGPDGRRGNRAAFARMGRKANIGHSHSAGIKDGIYQAGTHSSLSPDWVRGPSSWSHTDILTYPNGKRTLLTIWNGKWRA